MGTTCLCRACLAHVHAVLGAGGLRKERRRPAKQHTPRNACPPCLCTCCWAGRASSAPRARAALPAAAAEERKGGGGRVDGDRGTRAVALLAGAAAAWAGQGGAGRGVLATPRQGRAGQGQVAGGVRKDWAATFCIAKRSAFFSLSLSPSTTARQHVADKVSRASSLDTGGRRDSHFSKQKNGRCASRREHCETGGARIEKRGRPRVEERGSGGIDKAKVKVSAPKRLSFPFFRRSTTSSATPRGLCDTEDLSLKRSGLFGSGLLC